MTKAPVFQRTTLILAISMILLTCAVSACTGSRLKMTQEKVVIDWSNWLKDGASVSWKLEPGTYKLALTASNDGVTAEWLGGSCPKTQPMQELTMTCEISRDGQLIITNPTVLGLGADTSTRIKVMRVK